MSMSVDFSFLRRMCSCPPMLADTLGRHWLIVRARGLSSLKRPPRTDPDPVRDDFEGARCLRSYSAAGDSICIPFIRALIQKLYLCTGFPIPSFVRFFGLVLGRSPGLWAATAASYCPSKAGEPDRNSISIAKAAKKYHPS